MSKSPKLRFKEFSGDWEVSTLNNIANITMGQSPIGESYNLDGDGIGLINGPVEFTDKYPVVVQYTTKPTKYCYKDDILFCVRGSSIGRMNISDSTYCIGRGVAAINAKEGKSTTNYIYSLLQSKLDALLNFSNGSTFPNISSEEIKKYSFKVPSLEEQEKIASFFSLIDDKISLQGEKVEALKDYKKGMMQKIFSRELRFKDDEGRDYPEWEEPSLEEQEKIASFFSLIDDKISLQGEKVEALKDYKKGMMQKIFSRELRFKDDEGRDYPEWEENILGNICKITTGKLDANAMVENGQYRFYTCAKEYYRINEYAFDTEALLISGNGAHVGYVQYNKGKFQQMFV